MSAYDEFRYEEQAINRVVRSLVIFQPVLENAFSHGFMEGDEIGQCVTETLYSFQ